MDYLKNIAKFDIIDKEGQRVPFILNEDQAIYLDASSHKDVLLKSRQIGFSSLILAIFTIDFLTIENSRSVCISHDAPSAQKLLDRVKFFMQSAADKGLVINFKINNRNELINADKNSTFYISSAGRPEAGRGDTINNLHLSEFAFYEEQEAMLASILQAVTPTGRVVIESTANGVGNYFHTFWEKSKNGESGFAPHFFDNSFYSPEFLEQKKKELGEELFKQEYPATELEAFLSSGNPFFDKDAMARYLEQIKEPIATFSTYYDLI